MKLEKVKRIKKMISKFASTLTSPLRTFLRSLKKNGKINYKGLMDTAVKAVTIGGRIPLSIGLMLILIGSAVFSLAEIYFYGRIEARIDVAQNVLVDGVDNTQTIIENFNLSIGDAAISNHTITNTADTVALVQIMSYVTPIDGVENGITVEYLRDLEYSDSVRVSLSGGYVDVNIRSEGEWIEWTFDFPSSGSVSGNGEFGAALVISSNGSTPSFMIHNNFMLNGSLLCEGQPSGTWLYTPYDPNGEWHNEQNWSSPANEAWWIETEGSMFYSENQNGILKIRINKAKLGKSFGWAIYVTTSGFTSGIPNGVAAYPASFNWREGFIIAEIFEEIPQSTIIAIPPTSEVEFVIRYVANASGRYTVETIVVPINH